MSSTFPRLLAVATFAFASAALAAPRHFIYFGDEREKIREESFLRSPAEGAQLRYTWRELEPEKDRYDFSAIRSDLAFLDEHRKKLFIQLQDVSFYESIVNVPPYLQPDGVARQYTFGGDDDRNAKPGGWVARRWDPAVRERFHRLLSALGEEFDGRIEGINLAETSVDFGRTGKYFPAGFTHAGYRDAVIANMTALRRAFRRSVAMQYANFMPGEWLPWTNRGHLDAVYRAARELGVAVAGPDLLPHKKGQMNHSYPRIRASSGVVRTGIAVQEGNYASHTVAQLHEFATSYLKVDYIFWFAEEPFYGRDVLPFLRATSGT